MHVFLILLLSRLLVILSDCRSIFLFFRFLPHKLECFLLADLNNVCDLLFLSHRHLLLLLLLLLLSRWWIIYLQF